MKFSPQIEDRARGIRSDAIRSGQLEVLAELFLDFEPSETDPDKGRVKVDVKRHDSRETLGHIEGAEKAPLGNIRMTGEPWDGEPIRT